jgi:ABC-type transport system involved in multi-copper enzyme maturation permease subunit
MATATTPVRPQATRPPRPEALFAAIGFAEWTKLRTLRSSCWTLLSAVIAMAGFGALLSAAYGRHLTPSSRAALDPASYSQSGFFLAQLAIGVLGVLVITGEYATGSIRSTLAAAPQRVTMLAAKASVFTLVAFLTGLGASFTAFFLGQAIFARKGIPVSLGNPGALRSVAGAALYLAVSGLLSLGLGALIRRTAGAIAILIALLIFLPVSVGALPPDWQNDINPYLPSVAGQMIIGRTKFTPPGHLLPPWTGFGVFCGYAAVTLIAAAITISRRDA